MRSYRCDPHTALVLTEVDIGNSTIVQVSLWVTDGSVLLSDTQCLSYCQTHNGRRIKKRKNHGAPSGVKQSPGILPHSPGVQFHARSYIVG